MEGHEQTAVKAAAAEEAARVAAAGVYLSADDEAVFEACVYTNPSGLLRGLLKALAAALDAPAAPAKPAGTTPRRTPQGADSIMGSSSTPSRKYATAGG